MKKERIDFIKEDLSRKIAGEIVFSKSPGKTIRKWRKIFEIPQNVLAEKIDAMPSVISDYENGRRKSPGTKMIKKLTDGMIDIDANQGGKVLKEFSSYSDSDLTNALLDMKEFIEPVKTKQFVDTIQGKTITSGKKDQLYGYTIIDSLKAIINFSPEELVKVYGLSTQRALVFTNLSKGRSPLVAIKVTNLRPSLVVLHGLKEIDKVAKRIAEVEGVGVVLTQMDIEDISENLKKLG